MTKYVWILILFLSTKGMSQLKSGDRLIGGTVDYMNVQGFSPRIVYGISGEYMIGKHLGIETSIAGGKDYFHFGPSIILIPLALLVSGTNDDTSSEQLVVILMGVASLFEHTNYHIPLSSHIELIPFASLLRLRYIYDENNQYEGSTFASWSIGTKLSLLTRNNWYINASVERTQFYDPHPAGIQTGIQIGYVFKSKNE